jgi:DUF2934 family protein
MVAVKTEPFRPTQAKTTLSPVIADRQVDISKTSADEVRCLAYKKWQQAGCPISDGAEFWLAAETEIVRGESR